MSVDLQLFDAQPFAAVLPLVPPEKAGDDWEYDEVVRFFAGKRLAEVTYQTIRANFRTDWTACHHLMSDDAFAFFLPALMRLGQDNYWDVSDNASVLADNLAFIFRRMAEGGMEYRPSFLLRIYSRQQLGVIARFLSEMSRDHYDGMGDLDDAAHALRLLWGKYLES